MRKLDTESSTDRPLISSSNSTTALNEKNLDKLRYKTSELINSNTATCDDNNACNNEKTTTTSSSSNSELYSDSLENLHQATDPLATATSLPNECSEDNNNSNTNKNSTNTANNSTTTNNTTTSTSNQTWVIVVSNSKPFLISN